MRFRQCPQGGHFGDSSYTISKKHAGIIGRTASLGRQVTVYVLSCPDYVSHHTDDTATGQVNGNIPLKTQQRVEMALSLFPEARIEVLLADSEVNHEGKVKDKGAFLKAIETSKDRIATKYPGVHSSTFFEEAGGEEEFMCLLDHFYKVLRSKVRVYHELSGGRVLDNKLSTLLEYERAGTGGRLVARGVKIDPITLAERVLRNSFAEMLVVGEIIRVKHSKPDGTCSAVVVFDQSQITSLINDGDKHGTLLKCGLSPVPLILANSASTV